VIDFAELRRGFDGWIFAKTQQSYLLEALERAALRRSNLRDYNEIRRQVLQLKRWLDEARAARGGDPGRILELWRSLPGRETQMGQPFPQPDPDALAAVDRFGLEDAAKAVGEGAGEAAASELPTPDPPRVRSGSGRPDPPSTPDVSDAAAEAALGAAATGGTVAAVSSFVTSELLKRLLLGLGLGGIAIAIGIGVYKLATRNSGGGAAKPAKLGPPTVQRAEPAKAQLPESSNTPLAFTVHGTNFAAGARVVLEEPGNDPTGGGGEWQTEGVTSEELTFYVTPSGGEPVGTFDVKVVNPDGRSAACGGCLTITAPPAQASPYRIDSVSPSTAGYTREGGNPTITIRGSGFEGGITVLTVRTKDRYQYSASPLSVTASEVKFLFPAFNESLAGTWDVYVYRSNVYSNACRGCLTITPPP
jgi:hypothetical protein